MTPALLGVLAACAWGVHDFIGRFATRRMGQLNTTLGVMLAGLVLVLAIAAWRGSMPQPSASSLGLAAAAGAAYALATLWLFAAYRIGSISIVSPLVGSYPALVVAWNVAWGSRPSLYAWLAMAAVMAGSAVVSTAGARHEEHGHIEEGSRPRLFLFCALSALAFAVAVTAGQAGARLVGEIEATLLARAFSVVTQQPAFLFATMRGPAPLAWWPALAAMGVSDTIAMMAIFSAGEMPGSEIAVVAGSSFGGVVALLGWLVLREPVTLMQWMGIGLIFGGTAVLTLGW